MLRSVIGLIASSFKKRDVYCVPSVRLHPRGGESGERVNTRAMSTGNVSTSEVGRRFLASPKSTLDKTALSRIESRESYVPVTSRQPRLFKTCHQDEIPSNLNSYRARHRHRHAFTRPKSPTQPPLVRFNPARF